ncbi:phosphatase PAP2 family protein [Pediococcus damnosus]|uniref:Membrane-associated phospholipid phosphatase n=1 Tax=Pediococcus damnosus TaxID=51663 RepID=A0AAC9B2T0_9LACO|nr:phosphatase PAP2 family protein [Pediococcus damnosus]AMV63220.1 Membrane-associated phospholipid phosphatase [Pediococcus damnosus]
MQKNRNWLFVGIIATILFLSLTIAVYTNSSGLAFIDRSIQETVRNSVNPSQTHMFTIIAFFGSPTVTIIATLLIAGAFWHFKNRVIASWIMLVQLGGDAVAFLIKEIIRRPRPNMQLVKDTGFSYPSGHTFSTALLGLTILFIIVPYIKNRETELTVSLLTITWFCFVAFSRFYLRDHFPSDVFASFLLALSWWEWMRVIYFQYKF